MTFPVGMAARSINRLSRRPIRVRWWIFAYMFAFAMLSYMQRNGVAVAAVTIMSDLRVTQWQIGLLNAAFTTAYALTQLPGGVIGQRFGARLTYVGVGIVGLIATLATPLAPVVLTGTALFIALLLAQAMLGVSQGPVFPTFAAVLEKWFPANRWAIANGLQTAGMLVGGAVTPILVVLLTQSFGWKGALLWMVPPVAIVTLGWAWYGRNSPREHPSVTPAEIAELGEGAHELATPVTWRRLLAVVSDRSVLLLAFSYLCMNYAFYLLSYWSFLYLVQVRHFSGIESGFVGMAPWVGAAIGAAGGGYLSDGLAERVGVRWGFRLVPLITLPVVAVLLLMTIHVTSGYAAVLALTAAFCTIEINEGAYWAATMHVARTDTGAATGVLNTGGNVGGIICQPIVAALSGAGLWSGAFASGSLFALVAAAAWLFINPNQPAQAKLEHSGVR
jgi:MFS transporter, ACS family, glucarate transporter